MSDLIDRHAAIDLLKQMRKDGDMIPWEGKDVFARIRKLPSVQPEQSSEIQDILEYLDTVLHPIISPDHWNVYSELHDMISMLPSVQPEIIRCKDCMHNGSYDTDCPIDWNGKEYCSFAERKEDE